MREATGRVGRQPKALPVGSAMGNELAHCSKLAMKVANWGARKRYSTGNSTHLFLLLAGCALGVKACNDRSRAEPNEHVAARQRRGFSQTDRESIAPQP